MPLLALESVRGELKRSLTRLSLMRHEHPHGGHVAVGRGTLEEWYYHFKKGELDVAESPTATEL